LVNGLLGLFSPFKFGLNSYFGYDITKFRDNIRFLEMCNNRDGEVGGIIALYFDGATCTFHELPPADEAHAAELQKWYNFIDAQRAERYKTIFYTHKLNKLKHKYGKLYNFVRGFWNW